MWTRISPSCFLAQISVVVAALVVCQFCQAQTSMETVAADGRPNELRDETDSHRTTEELLRRGKELLIQEARSQRDNDVERWESSVRELVAINDGLRSELDGAKRVPIQRLKRTVRGRLLKARRKLIASAKVELENTSLEVQPGARPLALPIDGSARVEPLAQIQAPFPQGGPVGGAVGFVQGGAQQGVMGQPVDDGEELVALIERTIRADIWQSVGGPAAITYYQPGLALVISAPGDVHDDVADLLIQLRRAN